MQSHASLRAAAAGEKGAPERGAGPGGGGSAGTGAARGALCRWLALPPRVSAPRACQAGEAPSIPAGQLADELERLRAQVEREKKQMSDHARHLEYLTNLESTLRVRARAAEGAPAAAAPASRLHAVQAPDAAQCCICLSRAMHPVLTPCAHLYCPECFQQLIGQREQCAACRREFSRSKVYQVHPSAPHRSHGLRLLRDGHQVPAAEVSALADVEVRGSFGTKVEHLVRHLLHLRTAQPGVQSLVFSHWDAVLKLVSGALTANGITWRRIGGSGKGAGQAGHPASEVLLLNARTDASGMWRASRLCLSHAH